MENQHFEGVVNFIKKQFPDQAFIPLHVPLFIGNEKKYLIDAIDSTYVSSVGAYVNKFEEMMCNITGAKYAVAIVNGTNALHMALLLADVVADDEVLSQALTFIATCNAISYIGAHPVFIDVDRDSLGMSPSALLDFLIVNAEKEKTDFLIIEKPTKELKPACQCIHSVYHAESMRLRQSVVIGTFVLLKMQLNLLVVIIKENIQVFLVR